MPSGIDIPEKVTGAAMMIIGAYLQISRSDFIDLIIHVDDNFFTATALLISSGTLAIVLSFFGCIGLWTRNQCIVAWYLLCVIVIMALSLTAGIIAYVFHSEIEDELQQKMLSGLKDKDKRDEWDLIQSKSKIIYQNNNKLHSPFRSKGVLTRVILKDSKPLRRLKHCCGVTNYTDWYGFGDPDYPDSIPDSCCDCPNCGLQGATVAYSVGCYEKSKDWVQHSFYMLGVSGVVLGTSQIIRLVSAVSFIISLRREKTMV